MDVKQLPLCALSTEKMGCLTQRQETISGNLANADTPGHRTRTIEAPDFARYLSGNDAEHRLAIAHTDEGHITTGPRLGGVSSMEAAIHGREQYSPDGNSVDV